MACLLAMRIPPPAIRRAIAIGVRISRSVPVFGNCGRPGSEGSVLVGGTGLITVVLGSVPPGSVVGWVVG